MAAVGPPSGTVEIEWTAGTWTDVSTYVALSEGMTGTFGRPTEFDDVSAGTWALTLRNDDGRFTPNNPLGPYYPNVVENIRLRVTLTPPSGSSYVRFLGYVTSIEPSFPDEDGNTSVVRIEAADALAVVNRRKMATGYAEQANFLARLNSSWSDVWNFDDPVATTYQNLGELGTRTTTATASIKAAASGAGAFSAGATDDNLVTDGALTFNPSGIIGQILEVDLSGTPGQIDFFVKIPTTGLAYNATPASRVTYTVADFWTATAELFSLRVENSGTTVDFSIRDSTGTFVYFTHVTGLVGDQDVDHNVWAKLTFIPSGANTLFVVNDTSILSSLTGTSMTGVTRMFIGGNVVGGIAGKQTNCLDMSLSGLHVSGSGHGVYYYFALGTPPITSDGVRSRFMELTGYGSQILGAKLLSDVSVTSGSAVITSATGAFSSARVGMGAYVSHDVQLTGTYFTDTATIASVQSPTQATLSATSSATNTNSYAVIGPAILGTDNRDVVRYNTDGQTLAEAMQLNARTVGGALWVNNTGVLTLILPDAMRSTTTIATVDIEADALASDLQLRRGIDQAPTRVTVSSPVGSQTVVDTVSEALGYRREMSVDTGCATSIDLAALGSYYLAATKALRITRLTVDLAQSQNNLYASFFGSLRPGARVRISNLPSATFGFTYIDIFIQGWTEQYDHESATITFDCSPADAPPEADFDDTEYGRFAAGGTLDLAFPITSAATALRIAPGADTLTATGYPVMTTSAGDYPLDIDLSGERVTLAAAPSTSTRTNRITNPSFETATTTWAAAGTSPPTIATSTLRSYLGTSSLKVTWPTAVSGNSSITYSATGLSIGTAYTWSAYVYVPAGSSQVTITCAGSPTSTSSIVANTGTTTDAWVRLAYAFTAASTSHALTLVTSAASVSGQVCFVDAALLEAVSASLGSYFDGTYGGGSWTGTANASTSTQTTQDYTGSTRGVAPSVARAHLGCEDIDAWHAASLAV